jgi:hypothetical protein
MTAFDVVEILCEFSKAIRTGLIALEGLHDVDGVDPARVSALMDSVRCVHSEATGFLASVIGAASVGK